MKSMSMVLKLSDCCETLDEAKGVIDRQEARLADLRADNAALRAALKPFAHPDLSLTLGGNCKGDESPVFQRNAAMLTLGHFRQARAALAGPKE